MAAATASSATASAAVQPSGRTAVSPRLAEMASTATQTVADGSSRSWCSAVGTSGRLTVPRVARGVPGPRD